MGSRSLGSPYVRELCKPQSSWLQPARITSKALPVSLASKRSISALRPDSVQDSTRTLASQQPKRSPGLSPRFSVPSRHASRLASAVLPRPGSTAETYVAYGMTQKLFEACSSQADYRIPQVSQKGAQVPKTEGGEDLGVGEGWWHEELGLQPTFSTWSQVTFLHMYLLTVRLRALPSRESVQTYSRHLIDHFSHSAEERMDILHGLTGRGIRNRFLKDLFIQWRGVIAAYDEGLGKGDAVLGAAVWRNLWKAGYTGPDGQDMDWTKVAWVVVYMRRVLSELSQMSEDEFIMNLGQRSDGKPGIFAYSELDKNLVGAKR